MTCYLHIGTMKTGTSSIQDFLYINRDKIKEQGFLYPVSIKSLYHMNDHNEFAEQLNAYLNKWESNFLRILQDLKQELLFEKMPTIIISTENIQYLLFNLDRIKTLKKILIDVGFTKIHIIVYLRDPQDLYISMCSQEVKDGSFSDFLQSPDKYKRCEAVCNHKKTLTNWSEVFGEESIIARIFDKNEFFQNDLIRDFTNIIGIKWDDMFQIPNMTNESLDLIGMELLHRINTLNVKLYKNRYVELINDCFDKYFTQKTPELKYKPPTTLLQSYNDYFKDGNEWVRRKYFPHKSSLFKQKLNDDYTENYELVQMKQEYWGQIAKCMAEIITTKNNHIIKQDEKLQNLQQELDDIKELTIKTQIEYRFGKAIINATTTWRKITLPFTLLSIYIFRQQVYFRESLKDSQQNAWLKYCKNSSNSLQNSLQDSFNNYSNNSLNNSCKDSENIYNNNSYNKSCDKELPPPPVEIVHSIVQIIISKIIRVLILRQNLAKYFHIELASSSF